MEMFSHYLQSWFCFTNTFKSLHVRSKIDVFFFLKRKLHEKNTTTDRMEKNKNFSSIFFGISTKKYLRNILNDMLQVGVVV